MKQLFAIIKKEIRDNIRDKRSLFFALMYGPLLLPLLMAGPMVLGAKKYAIDYDEPTEIHMVNADSAPNLVQYLREQNLNVVSAEEHFREKIIAGDTPIVLVLDDDYRDALKAGKPAQIRIYYDQNNDDSTKAYRKAGTILNKYSRQILEQRFQIRGIDPSFLRPIMISGEELGRGNPSGKILAQLLPFIIVLSLTLGGFYLAVDSTAGERERNSLEPLLSLSVSRLGLVMGKFVAIMCFVGVSGLLSVTSSYILLELLANEFIRSFIVIDPLVFMGVFLLSAPLIFFFTSALMMIATFSKNTKEAQTHLGFAMMVPMAPFFIMQFLNVKAVAALMWVPVMSQFILIEQFILGESLEMDALFASVAGAFALGGVFLLYTIYRYSQESILDSA